MRIVHFLAEQNRRCDAKTISQETGVTLRFALKILRKLVGTGIVKSFKGTQGGYEIAKELTDISLRDVIETVEGPYVISRCVSPDFICSNPGRKEICQFNTVFSEISEMVNQRLEKVKFSEIGQPDKK